MGRHFGVGINRNEMRGGVLSWMKLEKNSWRVLGLGFVFTDKLEIGSVVALRRLLGLATGQDYPGARGTKPLAVGVRSHIYPLYFVLVVGGCRRTWDCLLCVVLVWDLLVNGIGVKGCSCYPL